MEAINELIAKSQSQAQQMLSASGYYSHDNTFDIINTPRTELAASHDNSVDSDTSFTGANVVTSSPRKPHVAFASPRK